MATRYKYTLSTMNDKGEWISTEYKFFPSAELDRLDDKKVNWKLAIEKNPHFKETK